MLRRVSAGLALLTVSSAKLDHWVLQFDGDCTQTGSNEVTCDGKALSQTISSYIDVDSGVDWSIQEQETGPVAQLYIISHGTSKGFDAEGSIKFMAGGPDQTPTTLNMEYNQDDVTRIIHGSHFMEAGFVNITGGTYGYEMAEGFLGLNINGELGDSTQWRAIIEASVGLPDSSQSAGQSQQQQKQKQISDNDKQQQKQQKQQSKEDEHSQDHKNENENEHSHEQDEGKPDKNQQQSRSHSHSHSKEHEGQGQTEHGKHHGHGHGKKSMSHSHDDGDYHNNNNNKQHQSSSSGGGGQGSKHESHSHSNSHSHSQHKSGEKHYSSSDVQGNNKHHSHESSSH